MAISKKFHEIKTFNSGIMAKPDDERDGPESAAVISLNIESLASGELRGIPKDVFLKASGWITDFSSISYEQGGRVFTEPNFANNTTDYTQ